MLLITSASVILSMILTLALTRLFGTSFVPIPAVTSFLCPVLVAWPVSNIFLKQSDQLEAAHRELDQAHRSLERTHMILEHRSRHDRMTGLANREAFLGAIGPGRRGSDNGFLIIIDADHFKKINDTFGHLAGDKALKLIADAISANIREGDIAARIGGEEFALFLPGSSLAEAIQISERVRQAVEGIEFSSPDGDPIDLTVSLGGAEMIANGPLDAVMGKADKMLYQAKDAGRNRAVVVPELAHAA